MNEMKQLPIRFPAEVKEWLAEQAKLHGSSQNSEVIRAVRERMAREEAKASDGP
ncbi:MAG: Arc family DNA-binding protein [Paracoccus sp. (in: a-proteobacteria)]|nr:Arc family DNA-binding protein [Paracoccus sp. (in: a-proteobacteria)]